MSLKNLPGKHHVSHEFPETAVHQQVAGFLTQNYPKIWYLSTGNGLFMDEKKKKQAAEFSRLQKVKGVPDLFIFKKIGKYSGLVIEIKKEGVTILKQNGELRKDNHISNQAAWLEELEREDFYSCFCIGYNQCKEIIEKYLNGEL
jgi:hypothetical protein